MYALMPKNANDRDAKVATVMNAGNATAEEAAQALDDNDNNIHLAVEDLYGNQQAILTTTEDVRNTLENIHHKRSRKRHKKRKSSRNSMARRSSSQQSTSDGDKEALSSTPTANRTSVVEDIMMDTDAKTAMIMSKAGSDDSFGAEKPASNQGAPLDNDYVSAAAEEEKERKRAKKHKKQKKESRKRADAINERASRHEEKLKADVTYDIEDTADGKRANMACHGSDAKVAVAREQGYERKKRQKKKKGKMCFVIYCATID